MKCELCFASIWLAKEQQTVEFRVIKKKSEINECNSNVPIKSTFDGVYSWFVRFDMSLFTQL